MSKFQQFSSNLSGWSFFTSAVPAPPAAARQFSKELKAFYNIIFNFVNYATR